MGWELIPAAIGGIGSASSGIKGKQAANEANRRQAGVDQISQGFMTQGMDMMGNMQNQANSFLEGGGMAGDLMNQAQTGGQQLSTNLNNLANQAMGVGNTYGRQLANTGANFDFAPGSNMMDQAMATFGNFAQNTRDQAGDQAAQAFTQGGGALDAALASRGISRGSGVAGGAMRDMAVQQGQTLAGVERDLANMGGQMGLEASQFDVNRMLQEQGMQSQFALGQAAQRGQNLMGAGQLALEGTNQAGNFMNQAYTNPLAMQQQMYQQNQLNPFMQMQSMMNPMDLIGMAFGGMNQATQTAGANAAAGGAGMGSGLSSLTGQMFDFLSNKNKPTEGS